MKKMRLCVVLLTLPLAMEVSAQENQKLVTPPRGTVEHRVSQMKRSLELTTKQEQKVYKVELKTARKMEKLQARRVKQINATLTDTQQQKWAKMEQEKGTRKSRLLLRRPHKGRSK